MKRGKYRIKRITAIVCILLGAWYSFAKIKRTKSDAEVIDALESSVNEAGAEQSSGSQNSTYDTTATAASGESGDTAAAEEQTTGVDPYTGFPYTVDGKVEYSKGHVKAKLFGEQGTFGLYAVRDDGKEIPLLSSYDFFSTSRFLLRIGRKEYVLNYSGGALSEARVTPVGVQMAYTIPGKAFFLVDFTFSDVQEDVKLQDAVKVTLYTENLGANPQTFTAKGIFDTVLGESYSHHFTTAAVEKLSNQKKFHSMKQDRWIRSANNKAAIEFILDGADVTAQECVSVGPLDVLSQYWEPEIHEERGYSTVRSYNNSGMAVNWKTAYLLPGQKDTQIFYITVAEGVAPVYAGRIPAGDELISSLEAGKKVFPSDAPAAAPVPDVELPAEPVQLSPAAQAITEEQLDPEYIQNLIDYIDSLQSADDIDRDELKSLNEELDAIFEKLGSMGR